MLYNKKSHKSWLINRLVIYLLLITMVSRWFYLTSIEEPVLEDLYRLGSGLVWWEKKGGEVCNASNMGFRGIFLYSHSSAHIRGTFDLLGIVMTLPIYLIYKQEGRKVVKKAVKQGGEVICHYDNASNDVVRYYAYNQIAAIGKQFIYHLGDREDTFYSHNSAKRQSKKFIATTINKIMGVNGEIAIKLLLLRSLSSICLFLNIIIVISLLRGAAGERSVYSSCVAVTYLLAALYCGELWQLSLAIVSSTIMLLTWVNWSKWCDNPSILRSAFIGVLMSILYILLGLLWLLCTKLILLVCLIASDLARCRVSKGYSLRWVVAISIVFIVAIILTCFYYKEFIMPFPYSANSFSIWAVGDIANYITHFITYLNRNTVINQAPYLIEQTKSMEYFCFYLFKSVCSQDGYYLSIIYYINIVVVIVGVLLALRRFAQLLIISVNQHALRIGDAGLMRRGVEAQLLSLLIMTSLLVFATIALEQRGFQIALWLLVSAIMAFFINYRDYSKAV